MAGVGANTMVPFEFHAPPRGVDASVRLSEIPEETSMRFSFPSAKNPMFLESGDQNGNAAPSVPFSILGAGESKRRNHSA